MKRAEILNIDVVRLDRKIIQQVLGNHTCLEELESCFAGADHFIHAAANTDVEFCETFPDECIRDNSIMPSKLAAMSDHFGLRMTFVSSTGVYGSGKTEPWAEYDVTRPTAQHHRSKLLGENFVLETSRRNLVVRLGWLFGGCATAPKNFVMRRILEANACRDGIMYANETQRGCPTFVDDAAQRIFDLIEFKRSGIFNVVNGESASRFEYVSEIIRLARLPIEVRGAAAAHFGRRANVSDNETAINWQADAFGFPRMRAWHEAISHYIDSKACLVSLDHLLCQPVRSDLNKC